MLGKAYSVFVSMITAGVSFILFSLLFVINHHLYVKDLPFWYGLPFDAILIGFIGMIVTSAIGVVKVEWNDGFR